MKIIECPRDAMQGLASFIPTSTKANYINQLLKVGFDTIDFGSFVSPKAIPQMKDTAEVLARLDLSDTSSKLLAIVANTRGAEDACKFAEIDYLGFPLSLSETFQRRNTNKSIEEAMHTVAEIQELCTSCNKEQVVYLSMGFGNPYGDPYEPDYVGKFVEQLAGLGVRTISLADTIGVSNPQNISALFSVLIPAFSAIEFGAHLHSTPDTALKKIEAAYEAGCRRFDGAIHGFGGCPMAKDELVGNIATESIFKFLNDRNIPIAVKEEEFSEAAILANRTFI